MTASEFPAHARRKCVVLALAGLVGVALWSGMALRRAVWEASEPIRYYRDVGNAYYWGREVVAATGEDAPSICAVLLSYRRYYDAIVRSYWDGDYKLDYPPLRLLVMTLWAWRVGAVGPGAADIPAEAGPLLRLNLIAELTTAVLMFVFVKRVLDTADATFPARKALAAALLVWFNPALILNAHGWPQWDCWVPPFYLGAVLAGVNRRWALAGGVLAIGALMKGQVMLITPVVALWPVFLREWRCVRRFSGGFLVAAAAVTAPFMVRTANAAGWVSLIALLAGLVAAPGFSRNWKTSGAIGAVAGAMAVFLSPVLFAEGSFAWMKVGFLYGSDRYPELGVGRPANFPAILMRWGLGAQSSVAGMRLATLLKAVCAALLVASAFGMARQQRGRGFLYAMAVPWILLFALMPQMHERYLLWGALLTAAPAVLGLGPFALHVLLSFMATSMTLHVMIGVAGVSGNPEVTDWPVYACITALYPGAGWAVLAVSLLFLALSLRVPGKDTAGSGG